MSIIHASDSYTIYDHCAYLESKKISTRRSYCIYDIWITICHTQFDWLFYSYRSFVNAIIPLFRMDSGYCSPNFARVILFFPGLEIKEKKIILFFFKRSWKKQVQKLGMKNWKNHHGHRLDGSSGWYGRYCISWSSSLLEKYFSCDEEKKFRLSWSFRSSAIWYSILFFHLSNSVFRIIY